MHSVLWMLYLCTQHRSEREMGSGRTAGWFRVRFMKLLLEPCRAALCFLLLGEAWQLLAFVRYGLVEGMYDTRWRAGDCSCNTTLKLAG
jgi:hypothetical protein